MSGILVQKKLLSFSDFQEIAKTFDVEAKIVQCHGVFDLLHVGHIKHFESAKAHGDVLVVTITPDRYVNKGPHRPCFTENLRAEAVAALAHVDYVIINTSPTAVEAIEKIKPHVYIKGAEYQAIENDITQKIQDEIDAVERVGGKIAYTYDATFSSSSLLNQFFSPFSDEVMNYLAGFKKRYSIDAIQTYFERARKLKILVVGEAIMDMYDFTDVIGKAGKEPTLVAKHKRQEIYAGGILALANHLSSFCEEITCLTYLGEAGEYEDKIRSSLKDNVKLVPIYKRNSPTLVKRRYLEEYLGQKLFEVYEINDDFLDEDQQKELIEKINAQTMGHDIVIVADYGHGLINAEAADELIAKSRFLAANTQSNAGNNGFNFISKYQKADYIAIANRELQLNYRQKHLSSTEQLSRLMDEHDYKTAMITQGSAGSIVVKQEGDMHRVPAFATKVVDRVGAGDAVLAITTLFAYQQAPSELIAFIGNVVGAEAVGIMGNKSFIERISLMKHLSHLLK